MSDTVKVIVSSSGEVVEVYAKAPSSPSGGGITGSGDVDRVLKILTTTPSPTGVIVTVGNSDIEDGTTGGYWNKTGTNSTLVFSVADTGLSAGMQIATDDGLGNPQINIAANKTGVYQHLLQSDQDILRVGRIDSVTPANNTLINFASTDIRVLSPQITAGKLAWFEDDGSGFIGLRALADGTAGQVLQTNGSGTYSWVAGGGGSGTVTSVSVVTANGISGSVATDTTTPAITLTLGAITPTSVNGLTISTSTGTLTVANGKTLTVSNTLTLTATDGSTLAIGTGGTLGTAAYTAASAYEVPLTFGSGVTRTVNAVANDLITGAAGGQTIAFGTNATDKGIFKATTGNQVTGSATQFRFVGGNNGASAVLNIGDGLAANIGELGMWAAGQTSSTTHFVRAGTNFTYLNAGTDLRLQVGTTSYLNCLSGAGTFAVQKPMTFATGANVTLVANSTTIAPLVFTGGGTYKTTPAAGSVEYNGQFSMTPTDATRRFVTLAASSTKVTAAAPYTNDGYIVLNINGTDVNVMTTA